MTVTVNGKARVVASGTTVAAVVESIAPAPSGVAVAVNDAIVPRAAWPTTRLGDGDRIEVLTAVQGG